jgi:uncharacterized membrane protein
MHFELHLLPVAASPWLALMAAVLFAMSLPGLMALRGHPERLHLVLGSAVALAVLWSVSARVDPGIAVHVLGTPLVALLLGWRLALVAAALAELALVLVGKSTPGAAPLGWMLSAALPAAVSSAVAWAARFRLPRNPFVFIFVCGFFGAGAAALATWLAAAGLLAVTGQPLPSGPGASLWAFLPLVLFPEAFINGALASMFIVYRPEWVRLYDERFYVRQQP